MRIYHSIFLILLLIFSPDFVFSHGKIKLNMVGNYRTGIFAEGATEIVAYDPLTRRLFSVNGSEGCIDVLSVRDVSDPEYLFSIDLSPYGKGANSVAVKNGIVAAAVEDNNKQAPGKAVLFWSFGNCKKISSVPVGALPDMITFTDDGKFILVANEGEPNDDYSVDPEGSVSVIDIRLGPWFPRVKHADFAAYNSKKQELLDSGVRIFGPNSTVAQDFEPEYIAISDDNRTAWVTLQENNAIAVIDIRRGKVTDILPLGYMDRMLPSNKMDASNEDGMINITNWPVLGMYQPDAIATMEYRNKTYIVTANEGDSRDYAGFSEEERVKDVALDPVKFPNAEELQNVANLGRLKITNTIGDTDNDGDFDELYCYGTRSFAIWTADGELVFDSGSDFEDITAQRLPENFNSSDEENNSFDDRSDDKGPETEGVVIGKIMGKTYAFIGLERISGVMVYDVSNPYAPEFVDYVNTRDFDGNPEDDTAGDISPEGLTFVPAYLSPSFKPLLIAAHEISGSIAIFEITFECTKENNTVEPASDIELTNYPNPFNPVTTISYSLPEAMKVSLTVYNTLGQKVASLVDEMQNEGEHHVKFDGSALASGLYIYTFEAGAFRKTQKLFLIK